MCNIFHELKEEVFQKLIRLNKFQEPYNEKSFKKIKGLKSLQKIRGVFRTHASIYWSFFSNRAFL